MVNLGLIHGKHSVMLLEFQKNIPLTSLEQNIAQWVGETRRPADKLRSSDWTLIVLTKPRPRRFLISAAKPMNPT